MSIIEKKVFTEQKDIPLTTLKDMVDEGDINTNPEYQREYIFTDKKASSLVESVIMGIPIPSVYLAEEDDSSYSVIDGQQRITALVKFMKNEYALTGLEELSELNGSKYQNFDKDIQKRFKSACIKAICLLKESKELQFEIFARLNQGSVKLENQELRNCIYRGSFNNMIEELANKYENDFYLMFRGENKRKCYQERILRFFALKDMSQYKGSLVKTFNFHMMKHQNDTPEKIKEYRDMFVSTFELVKRIMGEDAFFPYDKAKESFSGNLSLSIYDSLMIPFSQYPRNEIIACSDDIRNAINNIKMHDEEYRGSFLQGSGSRVKIINRIGKVSYAINGVLYVNRGITKRLFSQDIKKKLFHEGYICSYCNNSILKIDDAEVDHIIPFSKGGKTVIENAQLLHKSCNRAKSDSTQ